MNFKALQRTPIFFQVYGIDCSKQIESSHIGGKLHGMTKCAFYSGPTHAQSPKTGPRPILIAIKCMI
jgi:hypothetical protein